MIRPVVLQAVGWEEFQAEGQLAVQVAQQVEAQAVVRFATDQTLTPGIARGFVQGQAIQLALPGPCCPAVQVPLLFAFQEAQEVQETFPRSQKESVAVPKTNQVQAHQGS